MGAKPGHGNAPSGCTANDCPAVTTQVIGNRCVVRVAVDPIRVRAGTVVYWTLQQVAKEPIVFVPTGIAIDDPRGEFIDPQISKDQMTYTWTAGPRGTRQGLKYSVHAVWMRADTDGVLCAVEDPIIVNEG